MWKRGSSPVAAWRLYRSTVLWSEPPGRPISDSSCAAVSQTQVAAESHPVHLVGGLVDDQVDLAVLFVEGGLAHPAHVGVLVDEALSLAVDENAVDQGPRRGDGQRHLTGVHVAHGRADGLRHADAAAVVAFCADFERAPRQRRAVLAQHVVVEDEAAGGEHDAAPGPQRHRLAEALRLHADDAALLTHQPVHPGVGRDRCAGPAGGGSEVLHEQPPRGALRLGQMTARRRARDLVERVGVLAAGVHEALRAVRRHGCVGAERRIEGHVAGNQPVEVTQALLAVAGDLGLVGIRTAGRHHVAVHVVERVLEATRLLNRRAPAEVDDALGQRRCAPGTTGPLGHQDLGACGRRAERRRRPGRAEPDDDHVRRVIPGRDLSGVARCHVVRLAHSILPAVSPRR